MSFEAQMTDTFTKDTLSLSTGAGWFRIKGTLFALVHLKAFVYLKNGAIVAPMQRRVWARQDSIGEAC